MISSLVEIESLARLKAVASIGASQLVNSFKHLEIKKDSASTGHFDEEESYNSSWTKNSYMNIFS